MRSATPPGRAHRGEAPTRPSPQASGALSPPSAPTREPSSPRVLFYSHDSFGLGHLRRSLALARELSSRDHRLSSLIVTGSTVASSYRLPPRVDTVKLPVLTKDGLGRYRPLRLAVELEKLSELRADLIAATASSFDPTVVIVDKAPLGLRGEMTPTLDVLRRRSGCRVVLGLRDIEDEPRSVRAEWRRGDLRALIEHYYDAILVYGPESAMDALDCLGWNDLQVPVHHVGYVGPSLTAGSAPDLPPAYLLVTAGGGSDGFALLASALRAIRVRPLPLPAVVVAGPLLADRDMDRLVELSRGLDVRLYEFRADMETVLMGARAVVSMAGYNTVVEALAARKPLLLVPRVHPRREQLLRATALKQAGLADMLHPDELSPTALRGALDRLLERRAQETRVEIDGARRAADLVLALDAEARIDASRNGEWAGAAQPRAELAYG